MTPVQKCQYMALPSAASFTPPRYSSRFKLGQLRASQRRLVLTSDHWKKSIRDGLDRTRGQVPGGRSASYRRLTFQAGQNKCRGADVTAMCMAAHLARSRFRSDQHAQVSRLATWLRKHQDEALPGGVQAQLLDCIQLYYKAAIAHPEIKVSHQLSIRRPRMHSAFKACIPS